MSTLSAVNLGLFYWLFLVAFVTQIMPDLVPIFRPKPLLLPSPLPPTLLGRGGVVFNRFDWPLARSFLVNFVLVVNFFGTFSVFIRLLLLLLMAGFWESL